MRVFVILLLFSASVSYATPTDGASFDADAVEARALASRRTIKSGEFDIQVNSNDKHESDVHYHIWLAADGQIRQERTLRGELQVSVFSKDFAYYYSARPGMLEDPDLTRRPPIERLPISEAKPDKLPHLICNPLVLMFTPVRFALLPHYGLESLVNARGRDNLNAVPASWEGLPAITLAFSRPETDGRFEYDVVPSRDFNIVRWRMTGIVHPKSGGELRFDNAVSCQLTELAGSVWFPTRVTLKNTWNGKTELDENVTIIPTHINEEIPARVFSLGWGNLPSKQLVVQHPLYAGASTRSATPSPREDSARGPLFWEGGTVRPLTQHDEVDRLMSRNGDLTASPSRPRRMALLLAAAGGLTILGWIANIVRARRRRSTG